MNNVASVVGGLIARKRYVSQIYHYLLKKIESVSDFDLDELFCIVMKFLQ